MKKSTLLPNQSSNVPYILAVVIMMTLAITGSVSLLIFRPEQDNSSTIGLIFGFLSTTTLSLLAFMKSQETHLSVNSRLDQFIESAKKIARAEGSIEGRLASEKRTDELEKSKK